MKKTIPYYNPNLRISQLFKAVCVRGAQDKCERFYQAYSGKKYVLLTNSCRAALSMVYSALFTDCVVLMSPLTCKAALSPIVESGNRIAFADIEDTTWNVDFKRLPERLPESLKAIQLTHFGGIPGDIEEIIAYAHRHNLLIVEDCAQGFGSYYKDKRLGSFGDVICFSGIKTTYGISGGVIATNDKQLYDKIRRILAVSRKENALLSIYRALRNSIDSYRSTCRMAQQLYSLILNSRPSSKDKMSDAITVQRPSLITLNIWAFQLQNCTKQQLLRTKAAQQIIRNLDNSVWKSNYYGEETIIPTKLFLHHPHISSALFIEQLNQRGIEAMHLQQKYESYYQDSMNDNLWKNAIIISENLKNFEKIHDTVISVPLYENMAESDRNALLTNLQTLVNKRVL